METGIIPKWGISASESTSCSTSSGSKGRWGKMQSSTSPDPAKIIPIWGEPDVPSGKHTKNYGKSPFLMGKLTISMAIFNSKLLITRCTASLQHQHHFNGLLLRLSIFKLECFIHLASAGARGPNGSWRYPWKITFMEGSSKHAWRKAFYLCLKIGAKP